MPRARRLALLALLAGCWRGEPPSPAPPPLRPEPEESAGRTRTGWVPGQPGSSKAREVSAPKRPVQDVARELSTLLRGQATQLSTYIAGPIVVLDLDAGTLTTECSPGVNILVQQWGQLLADPARSAPNCIGSSQTIVCSQRTMTPLLIVELEDPDQPRMVSVIVGNFRAGRAAMNQKLPLMRSMIANATCP